MEIEQLLYIAFALDLTWLYLIQCMPKSYEHHYKIQVWHDSEMLNKASMFQLNLQGL